MRKAKEIIGNFGILLKGDITHTDKQRRIFSGWGSVQIVDRQGDLIPIEEFKPVMEILMRRGAPVMDSHTNHQVGRIIDYEFKNTPDGKPGLYLTAEIFHDFPTDDEVWQKILDGKYTGFSLGGKAGIKKPICNDKGCYNLLGNIEVWEFSIVERPANQLALIEQKNELAKGEVEKARVYIKDPSEAPEGAKIQRGPRGGLYYESNTEEKVINTFAHPNKFFNTVKSYLDDFAKKQNIHIDLQMHWRQKELNGYIEERGSGDNLRYILHLYVPDKVKLKELNEVLKHELGHILLWQKNKFRELAIERDSPEAHRAATQAGSSLPDLEFSKFVIQKPFAGYKDFQDCVNRNRDKGNPRAYCGKIYWQVEGKSDAPVTTTTEGVYNPVYGKKPIDNIRGRKIIDDILKYVRRCGSKWCVYSHSGKVLGRHDTKESANRQLRAIEANKEEYIPPPSGDLPERKKRVLARVYAECRKKQKRADKAKCAKIAWGAVHRMKGKVEEIIDGILKNRKVMLEGR